MKVRGHMLLTLSVVSMMLLFFCPPNVDALLPAFHQRFSVSAAAAATTAATTTTPTTTTKGKALLMNVLTKRGPIRPFHIGKRMTLEMREEEEEEETKKLEEQVLLSRKIQSEFAGAVDNDSNATEGLVSVVFSSTLRAAAAAASATAAVPVPKDILFEKRYTSSRSLSLENYHQFALAWFGSTEKSKFGLSLGVAAASLLLVKQLLAISTTVGGAGGAGGRSIFIFASAVAKTTKILASGYMTLLHQKPIITKSITAGTIRLLGDFMAQKLGEWLLSRKNNSSHNNNNNNHNNNIIPANADGVSVGTTRNDTSVQKKRRNKYDRRRGLSVFLDGLFISGPLLHLAYGVFENLLPSGSSSWAAISHVLADAVILDSIFVATALIVTGWMEGYTYRQIVSQMKRDYKSTLTASWVTSIGLFPIQFFSFRFLPVTLRVLAINCVDVIWDTVVSYFAHRNRKGVDKLPPAPADVQQEEQNPSGLVLEKSTL